jgi:alpha-D-ribose 1-methylphosphonate 5-triphosphate synthase subunit PhnI
MGEEMKIKRFEASIKTDDYIENAFIGMEEDEDGDWCRYEEAVKAVEDERSAVSLADLDEAIAALDYASEIVQSKDDREWMSECADSLSKEASRRKKFEVIK